MALQDILDAIIAQSDLQITTARSEHQKRVSQLREAAERTQAKKRQDLAAQKEKKKAQLKMKAEAHAEAMKRNTVLRKKRELLDRLYNKATDALASVGDEKIEPLLRAYLKEIPHNGNLHPSEAHAALLKKIAPSEQFSIEKPIKAKGGFLYTSVKTEEDNTFEHRMQEWLRPQTELYISKALFTV